MGCKINKDNIIKHEFNILFNILNPTKRAKPKMSNYSPILQGCINTHIGRAKLRNFRIILDSRSISTIVIRGVTHRPIKPPKDSKFSIPSQTTHT